MPWIRDPDNPIIRPEPGTWKHHRCTSCTLAFKDGQCFFYHDGGIGFWWDGVPGFNWIGLLTCPEDRFDGKTFEPFLCNPVLTHGRFCDIDRLGMISPRVRIIDDMFHLYYNATSYESFTPGRPPVWRKTIGLATSPDGINFEKVGGEGVVRLRPGYGAGTPTPFLHEGRWHMLTCQAPIDRSRGYGVYVTVSDNPRGFDRQLECVFGPGAESAWDGHSVVAPAFCLDEGKKGVSQKNSTSLTYSGTLERPCPGNDGSSMRERSTTRWLAGIAGNALWSTTRIEGDSRTHSRRVWSAVAGCCSPGR